MKKMITHILIICLIFSFTSCAKKQETLVPPAETPVTEKKYIANPKIVVSSSHHYQGTSWVGDEAEVKNNTVSLSGDIIGFEITCPISMQIKSRLSDTRNPWN